MKSQCWRTLLFASVVLFSATAVSGTPNPAFKGRITPTKQGIVPPPPEDTPPDRPYRPPVVVDVPPAPGVSTPNSETSWEHGERNTVVEWNGLDGILVKIEIYKNGIHIGDFSDWIDNSGRFVRTAPIPAEWGSGPGFEVRIKDNYENELRSGTFRLSAPISVSSPSFGTRWATGQTGVELLWSAAQGNNVKIQLFRGETLLEDITAWVPNTGSYTLANPVPGRWGTGSDYRIVITDDLGNSYPSGGFSIDPIWVYMPARGSVWNKGRAMGPIRWNGGGTVAQVELYRGSTRVHQFSTGWVDNTRELLSTAVTPESWQNSTQYRIKVTSMEGNDLIIGWSDYFEIRISNDSPSGADPLVGNRVQSEIEEHGDGDYWVFQAEKDHIYRVSATSPAQVNTSITDVDGNSLVAGSSSSRIDWYCHRTGDYLIHVEASDGNSITSYTVDLERRLPPERQRSILISAGYGPASSLGDVITGGYNASVAYMPVRYLEVGTQMYGAFINEDAIIPSETTTFTYLGGYAGLRAPELFRLTLRAGAGYYSRMDDNEAYIRHEFSEYVDAINSGLRFYVGVDWKISYKHLGSALYAQLQQLFFKDSQGVIMAGLGVAF